MAKFFAKPFSNKFCAGAFAKSSAISLGDEMDECHDVLKEQRLMTVLAKIKGEKLSGEKLSGEKLSGEKLSGEKLSAVEIGDLMAAFAEFSRLYAKGALVMVESEKDVGNLDMLKDGKGMVDKGKGKETGSEDGEREEMDGYSWAKKYLPANGFWAC